MKTPFLDCDRCGKNISFGDAFVSINRFIEQAEFIAARNRVEYQPIDSIQIATLCARCANLFDVQALAKIIKSVPTEDPETTL